MSGLSPRTFNSCIAQVLPSGSANPKKVPPSCATITWDVADLHSAPGQLVVRRLCVGDDQLQGAHRAGRHLVLRREVTDDDGAPRAVRGELRDVHVLLARVVIHVEADLVAVELDCAVDVGDGQYDYFEGPIHGGHGATAPRQRTVTAQRRARVRRRSRVPPAVLPR